MQLHRSQGQLTWGPAAGGRRLAAAIARPLESLRKTELKEACGAEKEEGAHEQPGLAPQTLTSGSPARCEV